MHILICVFASVTDRSVHVEKAGLGRPYPETLRPLDVETKRQKDEMAPRPMMRGNRDQNPWARGAALSTNTEAQQKVREMCQRIF